MGLLRAGGGAQEWLIRADRDVGLLPTKHKPHGERFLFQANKSHIEKVIDQAAVNRLLVASKRLVAVNRYPALGAPSLRATPAAQDDRVSTVSSRTAQRGTYECDVPGVWQPGP